MPRKRGISKSPYGNHVHNGHEATICRVDQSVKEFKLGDITWIKTRDCWWPGQVVGEGSVSFRPKKKVKDGVLVRMYGCYEFLYVDPAKYSNEFENILKQENLTIREAFQKAMDEVTSVGKSKGKVSTSRVKDVIKDKKRKQDEIERTEMDDKSSNLGVYSGEAEEVSALEKKKDEARVKAMRGKKLKQNETTNPQLYAARTRSRDCKDQSTELEGAQDPNVKEKAGPGVAKVKQTPKVASNITKEKDVKEKIDGKQKPATKASKGDSKIKANMTEKAKVGTRKGKNSKQEDVKEPTQTKSPATTMNHLTEEPTPNQSERCMRVMQSLGLIAPVGSPFRRNGFVIQSSLQ